MKTKRWLRNMLCHDLVTWHCHELRTPVDDWPFMIDIGKQQKCTRRAISAVSNWSHWTRGCWVGWKFRKFGWNLDGSLTWMVFGWNLDEPRSTFWSYFADEARFQRWSLLKPVLFRWKCWMEFGWKFFGWNFWMEFGWIGWNPKLFGWNPFHLDGEKRLDGSLDETRSA